MQIPVGLWTYNIPVQSKYFLHMKNHLLSVYQGITLKVKGN